MAQEDIDEMIHVADKDGDGRINYEGMSFISIIHLPFRHPTFINTFMSESVEYKLKQSL